jgi:hypothetical protein
MAFLSVPPEVMRPTALVLNLLMATIVKRAFEQAWKNADTTFTLEAL